MIKRIFVLVVAVAMSISASAQSEAGSLTWQPNVGVTYTTGIVDGLDDPVDGAYGLTFGVEAMYMLKEKLGIALGLNYTGYNVDDDDIAYSGYDRFMVMVVMLMVVFMKGLLILILEKPEIIIFTFLQLSAIIYSKVLR